MLVITVARKPMIGTVAQNLAAFGTGTINIDESRVGYQGLSIDEVHKQAGSPTHGATMRGHVFGLGIKKEHEVKFHKEGRWPSNLILEHRPGCKQTGTVTTRGIQKAAGVTGFGDGRKGGYVLGTGAEYGPEQTVGVWACVPGCPVPVLDAQSAAMGMHSAGSQFEGFDYPHTGNFVAYKIAGRSFRHGDAGNASSASRFFAQFRST